MGQFQTKNKKKKVEKFESKEEYFIRNGGILLSKQMALSRGQSITRQLKIITQDEIKNARNNYDPGLLIPNRFPRVNVYRAALDDRLVFIVTPKNTDLNPEIIADFFLTDVSTLTVMHHENLRKIYGCCLETLIPMTVCECSSLETKDLHQCLHGYTTLQKPMKWSSRLRVATDIAYALSYMHNGLSKPVVHRDVKSISVIVDSPLHALLANAACSVSITPGKKDERWPILQGTPGYMDPEYIETGDVTEKCDVYSFGVVMLELITGIDPSEMVERGKNLVDEFRRDWENNFIEEMMDQNALEEGNNKMDEVQRFSRLALKCVERKGEERPTMISVVEQLWRIQDRDDNNHGCGSKTRT